jgi:8-oxo-dGTP diphosphatase
VKHPEVRFCIRCGTTLEQRKLFGTRRPICPSCGWVYFEDPKVAVGVLAERDKKVLLVKRLNEPKPGSWSIPAGFMDAHEDPRQAAERECLEETGLIVRTGDVAAVVGGREHSKGADIVIAYHATIIGGELKAGDDASDVGFFARDALPPLAFRATRVVIGLEWPFY